MGAAFQQRFVFPVVSPHGCEIKGGKVVLKMQSGRPALVCRETGKGKAWLFGFSMQDTYFNTWKSKDSAGRQELEDLISDVFRESKIQSHISSSNPDIEASVRANTKEGYVFVINHEAENSGTSIRIAGLDFLIGNIIDIETGRPVPYSEKNGVVEFNINAAFGGTRLLKLLPE